MLFDTGSPVIIKLKSKDPTENLAAEEYCFSQRRENFILLWQNSPCVIIGKNQFAENEVSEEYIGVIPVIKRSTGGGAVYHDENNLNFSFIKNDDGIPDMKKFTEPVTSFLSYLGIKTAITEKNDILLDGKKISGCASRTKNGRVLFHGTLLFRCDGEKMEKILTPSKEKLEAHAVSSVKARVGELYPYLNGIKTVGEFRDLFEKRLICTENATVYEQKMKLNIKVL